LREGERKRLLFGVVEHRGAEQVAVQIHVDSVLDRPGAALNDQLQRGSTSSRIEVRDGEILGGGSGGDQRAVEILGSFSRGDQLGGEHDPVDPLEGEGESGVECRASTVPEGAEGDA
jgi:hypothetical protein